jgi:hypothetical protein
MSSHIWSLPSGKIASRIYLTVHEFGVTGFDDYGKNIRRSATEVISITARFARVTDERASSVSVSLASHMSLPSFQTVT